MSNSPRAFQTVLAYQRTTALRGVQGGAILEAASQVAGKLRVGIEIAIKPMQPTGPIFYGLIKSIIAANHVWVLMHVRGEVGGDCLLLARQRWVKIPWYSRYLHRCFPDRWLDAFPPPLPTPPTHNQDFELVPYPSPPSPTLPPAPPPSFAVGDEESLIYDTAFWMVEEHESQLRAWLRKGCPGGGNNTLDEHITAVLSMNDARSRALQTALQEDEAVACRTTD